MRRQLLERPLRHRFAWLFGALLATLAARAVLDAFGSDGDPFGFLVAASLGVAALGLAREPRLRWLVALVAALVVARAARGIPTVEPAHGWDALLWSAGFALAGVACVRHMLAPGRVDGERIFAALDAYFLAALLFGAAYWGLGRAQPGAFAGEVTADGLDVREAIYLSFVTIASLGYGDIVPRSAGARALAIVEAVGGQLFLVVLVARLVNLYRRPDDAGS